MISSLLSVANLLALTAFLTPTLLIATPLALAPLLIAAAVLVLVSAMAFRVTDTLITPPRNMVTILGAFLFWGLASAFWSLDFQVSLERGARLMVILASGLVIFVAIHRSEESHRRVARMFFLAGLAAAIVFLGFEATTGNTIARLLGAAKTDIAPSPIVGDTFSHIYKGAVSILVVLTWPAVAIFFDRERGWLAHVLIAVVVILSIVLVSRVAVLACVVSAIIFLLARHWTTTMTRTVLAMSILVVVTWPTVPHLIGKPDELYARFPSIPLSALHRLFIAEHAAERIAAKPVTGWGLDSSRVIGATIDQNLKYDGTLYRTRLHDDDLLIKYLPPTTVQALRGAVMPLHPHSVVLQTWLELGVVGAILLSSLLVIIIRAIERLDGRSELKAAALAQFTSGFVIANVSFGIWQTWWLSALFLSAGLMAIASRGEPSETA
jgi:O-antigen ligase